MDDLPVSYVDPGMINDAGLSRYRGEECVPDLNVFVINRTETFLRETC